MTPSDQLSDIGVGLQLADVQRLLKGLYGVADVPGLVEQIAMAAEADYAVIALLRGEDIARTDVVWDQGKLLPNFDYDLRGTPCEDIVGKHTCYYYDDVQRQFPTDKILIDMGVSSYFGTPLRDSSDNCIGLIALLGKGALPIGWQSMPALKMFATAIAAMYEHSQIAGA